MSKCPRCGAAVRTPFFLNQQAWSTLTCPHCEARLKIKGLRSAALIPLMVSVMALGPMGHDFAILGDILIAAIVLIYILECMHPQLAFRKEPPAPEIRLNIGEPTR